MLSLDRSRISVTHLLVAGIIAFGSACAGGGDNDEMTVPEAGLASTTPTIPIVTATAAETAMAPQLDVTPTASAQEISPAAEAYLDEALGIMEEFSINRDRIDWPELRAGAFERAAGALDPTDTYRAIEWALRELNDNHSFFMTPEAVAARTQSNPDAEMPTGQMIAGHIGYIWLPAMRTGEEDQVRYATTIVEFIRQHDASVCGWVVDLRDNGGGNMWPMIAGLGPVLGEGTLGYFVDPEDTRAAWSYYDGMAMSIGAVRAYGPEYRLRDPDAPVAVLTGRRTASSGEAVAVAFRGREHSRSFGSETAGVPTANNMFPLSDGAWLVLIVAEMADRDGNTYNSPIEPDVETSMNRSSGLVDEPVVVAGIEWLQAQPACN